MARTSVTSLLRTAAARQRAVQTEQSRIIDTIWNTSAKTDGDLASYKAYYDNLALNAQSSDRLTYQNKLNSANKAFVSNELQRASIAVLEGTGTSQDKLNKMVSFYNDAVNNGDLDFAQSLRLQIDNLYKTVAQDQVTAYNTAKAAYDQNYTDVKTYVSDLIKGDAAPAGSKYSLNDLNRFYESTTPDNFNQTMSQIFKTQGKNLATYEQMALSYAEETLNTVASQVAQYPVGSKEYMNLTNELYKVQNDEVFSVPSATGGKISLSIADLREAVNAQAINGTGPLTPSISADGRTSGFVKNDVGQYELGVNPATGQYEIVPRYVSADVTQMLTGEKLTPFGAFAPTGMSNLPKQQGDYTFVTADIGDGRGTQTYALKNGELFNVSGGAATGKAVSNLQKVSNYIEKQAKAGVTVQRVEQQYMTPEDALRARGIEASKGFMTVNNQRVPYKVDQNGNIQYTIQRPDPATGKMTAETITWNLKTGQQSSASQDVQKMLAEQQRIAKATTGPQQIVQGQTGAGEVLQGAGTTQVLQKAATTQKGQTTQQAAGLQTLQQVAAQPLAVAPLPQQISPLKVLNEPVAPKISVAPAPVTQPLSIYQAPLTATAPLTVKAQPVQTLGVITPSTQPSQVTLQGGAGMLQGGSAPLTGNLRVQ